MSELKVMQVLPDLNSGGAERGTLEIAAYLQGCGVRNIVCSGGGLLVKELEESGVQHVVLPVYSKNPFVMLLNVYRLVKLIRLYGIKVVHARSRAPAWSCYFACRITGIKFVTTFHAAYSALHPWKRLYNSIMLNGDRVIAISRYIKKHIETRYRFTSSKLVVIDRGVDLHYFAPKLVSKDRIESVRKEIGLSAKAKGEIILLPARFTRIKGHLYLLKMLKYLKHKNYRCVMVGKVADAQVAYVREIEDAIKEYGLEDRVLLHKNHVVDMPALYMLSDFVISTSTEPEGFGRTIIEAQAMGRPIIATQIGAPSEIVKHAKTGFLVPSTDAASAAEILDDVLGMDKEAIEKVAAHALKVVKERYSLEGMCDKTLQVYYSLLESEGA